MSKKFAMFGLEIKLLSFLKSA